MPEDLFNKTVSINAPATEIWTVLTEPHLMKKWMGDMVTDIITNWQQGSSITIQGAIYKKPFENTGTVLSFKPYHLLEYTHLSSLSRLPGADESYCKFSFLLTPANQGTELSLTISNFPTEAIYKHLVFYWNVVMEILKKQVEQKQV